MALDRSGVIIVDKPEGLSSAKTVAHVKKILGAKKIGHAGTLDPFATGIMVCCVNQATRLARFFLHGTKAYDAEMELGIQTDTQDFTGTVTARHKNHESNDWTDLDMDTLHKTLNRFVGDIEQVPPAYSALKYKGIPLYKYARKGEPVRKPPRRISISELKILNISLPDVRIRVRCSAGTYIRTLCADIGSALGYGACLKTLRRIESSGFSHEDATSLPALKDLAASGKATDRLVGMADALRKLPGHVVDDGLAKKIRNGIQQSIEEIEPDDSDDPMNDAIKVLDRKNNLVAVLKRKKEEKTYHFYCVFPE